MVTAVQTTQIFPPKVLEKYGRPKYACAVFFLIIPTTYALFENFIFPAKNLEKIRALRIRMRRFFLISR